MLSNDDDDNLPPVSLSDSEDEISGINGHSNNGAPASLVLNSHYSAPEPVQKLPEVTQKLEDICIDDNDDVKPKVQNEPSPSAPPNEEHQSSSNETNGQKAADEEDPNEVFKDGSIQIFIRAYERKGEGINAYLVYKIETRVHNIPGYNKNMSEVWRRFSDFLGLREKLFERYQPKGIVVPMAPNKSIKALTKTKLNTTDDESYTSEVAEKRTRQLERFLRRLIRSPRLVTNCDLIDFLQLDANLPRATSTQALSATSMKKVFKSFGEIINKNTDRWFEQAHGHIEELEDVLQRLQSSVDALVSYRRELSQSSEALSKALSMNASCEENTALSRTLSKLSETHENLSVIQKHESEQDSQLLAEVLTEHLQLTQVLKELFYERVKTWQQWQTQHQTLVKKRESKARFDLGGNAEKARQAKSEVEDSEQRVDAMEKEFLQMSKLVRSEYSRISAERCLDIKNAFIERLESLAESEQQILETWQKFAPEIKNIIN
ncbi:Sorting nexin-2 [Aphelenchoides bicaudatus]|nr:Sorting nexin-2 [Aphelenchoides bicaudatus]